jgi:hypothetical protein
MWERNMKKYLKIKHWHTRGCCLEGTDREMFFPTKEMFFGNYAGNKSNHGNHYFWIEMQCNDPKCGFKAVIDSDALSEMIKN